MIEEEKELDRDDYEGLFNSIGFKKSKKLVSYLMNKVILFKSDYKNPNRLDLMKQLKDMKPIYEKVFHQDMI